MPAKSDAQRKAAGAALSAKRKGSSKNLKDASRSMHDSMTEDELEDFATEKTHLESYPNPGEAQGKGAFSSANSESISAAEEKQSDPYEGREWGRGKLTGEGGTAGTTPSGGYKADSDWKAPVGTDQRLRKQAATEEELDASREEESEAKEQLKEDIETLTAKLDKPLEKMLSLLEQLHSTHAIEKSLEEIDVAIEFLQLPEDIQKHYGKGHEVPYTPDKKDVLDTAAKAIEKYMGTTIPRDEE